MLLAVLVAVTVLAGLLLVIGITVHLNSGGWTWGEWWTFVADTGNVLAILAGIALHAAFYGAAPVWLVAAFRAGRNQDRPRWMASPAEVSYMDAAITADGISLALAAVKLRDLTKYINEGGRLEFVVPPREQGGGTYCQVKLPIGVMAADLLKAETIERLAGNLNRHKHEVYPQRDPAADARVLDLWVADKGALDRPAPPYPLLHDGVVDVWRDRLPWGVSMRSEPIAVGALQKHWLIGATSKQGKTMTFRVLLLGIALDPTTEIHIADLKGDGDWSMFAGRAATLIEGGAHEHAVAACELLEWGVAEMRRRYEVKTEKNLRLTRELSRQKGSGFHPIYLAVDECQILYGAESPIGGTKNDDRAWRAAKTLHEQARAVNIHLMQATQRPDNRTLPVQVREGAHVRAALNVPNVETARMVLADAVDRGARPQDLRMGLDRGTIVLTGEVEDIPTGQAFVISRTHYVDDDQSAAVVARSIENMHRQGRTVTQRALHEPPQQRDFLADLDAVMHGEPRVRTEVLRQRLAEHHSPTYEGWSAGEFTSALAEHGIQAYKSHGVMTVRADDIPTNVTESDRNGVGGATPGDGEPPGTAGSPPRTLPRGTSPH